MLPLQHLYSVYYMICSYLCGYNNSKTINVPAFIDFYALICVHMEIKQEFRGRNVTAATKSEELEYF